MRDSSHIMLCERFWKDVPGGNPDRKTLPQWKAVLPGLLKKGEVTLDQMYPRSLSLVHQVRCSQGLRLLDLKANSRCGIAVLYGASWWEGDQWRRDDPGWSHTAFLFS